MGRVRRAGRHRCLTHHAMTCHCVVREELFSFSSSGTDLPALLGGKGHAWKGCSSVQSYVVCACACACACACYPALRLCHRVALVSKNIIRSQKTSVFPPPAIQTLHFKAALTSPCRTEVAISLFVDFSLATVVGTCRFLLFTFSDCYHDITLKPIAAHSGCWAIGVSVWHALALIGAPPPPPPPPKKNKKKIKVCMCMS